MIIKILIFFRFLNTTLSERFVALKIETLQNLATVEEIDTSREANVKILGIHALDRCYRCISCNTIVDYTDNNAHCSACDLSCLLSVCGSTYNVKVLVQFEEQNKMSLAFTDSAFRALMIKIFKEQDRHDLSLEEIKKAVLEFGNNIQITFDAISKLITAV